MRFIIPFLAMFGLAAAVSPLSLACNRKNKYVVQAVNDFCRKKNMVVPSDYAGSGKRTNHYAVVYIAGSCRPPQWVPSHICKSQFFNMCIRGDSIGQRIASFGRNKCQTWEIFATKSQHRNAPDNPDKGKKISKGTWKGIFKSLGWHKRDVDDQVDELDDEEDFVEEPEVAGAE